MLKSVATRRLAVFICTGSAVGYNLGSQSSCKDHVSEPKEPGIWDHWSQLKSYVGHLWTETPHAVTLPTDKLACHIGASSRASVVLVSCGSFNPPTLMHTRMLELARDRLMKEGYDVLGSYMSPVNDAYWKKELQPSAHRVRMCELASSTSDHIMVDSWEAQQKKYVRTLHVLQHVSLRLKDAQLGGGITSAVSSTSSSSSTDSGSSKNPRVMLVCGADVVESMSDANVWKQDLLQQLLEDHGVVCITRNGGGVDVGALLLQEGTLLNKYRENVAVIDDPIPNNISSTLVRRELEQGNSVKYLVDDSVIAYIKKHKLFG